MNPAPSPKHVGPPRTPLVYRAAGRILGPLERWLGVDCRTFTHTASARLDGTLTLRQQFIYHLHRVVCRICRQQDNHSQCLSRLLGLAAQQHCFHREARLPEAAKQKLREKIAAAIKQP